MQIAIRSIVLRSIVIRSIVLAAALAVAVPALAQQPKTHPGRSGATADTVSPSGFVKYCGAHFGCYTGMPLQCSADTRPYQNVALHQCFCLPDGCPQH
jgi:hypothetical protein